jgi:hypothetical protein
MMKDLRSNAPSRIVIVASDLHRYVTSVNFDVGESLHKSVFIFFLGPDVQ